MKTPLRFIGLGAAWFAALTVLTHAQVPHVISYQGRVRPAFSGRGQFQFALVDSGAANTYWSNDGTIGAGAVPTAIVEVPVSNGVYSVYLGHRVLTGMTNIPPSVFTNDSVYLRVWFSDGSVAPVLTTPDTRIVSVGYAMIAASVVDGNITEAKLADGAVTSSKLAAGAITSSALAVGSVTTDKLVDNAVTGDKVALGTITGRELAEEISLGSAGTGAGLLEIHSAGVGGATSIKLDGSEGLVRASQAFQIGSTQALLSADSYGGRLRIYDDEDSEVVDLEVSSSGTPALTLEGGYINVKQLDGQSGVKIEGNNGGAGLITVWNSSGNNAITLDGAESGSDGGQILLYNANQVMTVQIDGDDTGSGGWIGIYDSGGANRIELDANASGGARITTQVLEITGGSDLSENFDITIGSDVDAPQAGLIVCIDPDSPGHLMVSSKAYDRTVAGVVSGAGGVKPGMLMGQHGTAANGKHPVALTGRVYCHADASNGAIQPGDLLTTSDLPGHAMKVIDHVRAQGAIIGKAMTPLAKDRGLVLVLISLQ